MIASAAGLAAAAADPKSTERLVVMGVLLLLVALGWWGMWRGWRRRAARQSALPGLPVAPPDRGEPLVAEADGVYVSTTSAGQWLDRVVARGLGVRSRATMTVTPTGIDFLREGAPDVFVPREAVQGARLDRAIAGKVGRDEAIVVVTWRLGEQVLDTGFRPRHAADRDALVSAVSRLVTTGSAS